jgi:membrane dipeptidase
MLTRRMFSAAVLAAGGGLALPRVYGQAAAQANQAEPIRIDALCYEQNLTKTAVENAIRGGMTAVVLDLAASPRDYDNAVRELSRWTTRFRDRSLPVLPVLEPGDFERARDQKQLGILLACQDATILGTRWSGFEATLQMFHDLGLRLLQLTHNERTPWGDSFMEKRDGGLSVGGESLIKRMNELGIVIDLSHCSRNTLLDTVAASQQPVAVTHAGCRAVANTARNKTDEEIRAIGKARGFFGIYNMSTWLTSADTASVETLVRHIDHAVQLIGAAHVGFGSDGAVDKLDAEAQTRQMARVQQFNGSGPSFEWPVRHARIAELNAPDRLVVLGTALARKGYSDADVRGIVGGNFVRLFRDVRTAARTGTA